MILYLRWKRGGNSAQYLDEVVRFEPQYAEAIRLNPQYAYAYYIRGVVNHTLGKNAAADHDFQKARDLGYTP